jgi:hypothetical protein
MNDRIKTTVVDYSQTIKGSIMDIAFDFIHNGTFNIGTNDAVIFLLLKVAELENKIEDLENHIKERLKK